MIHGHSRSYEWFLLASACLVSGAACGDDSTRVDGGLDGARDAYFPDGGSTSVQPPTPPAPPAPAASPSWPCPDGWRAVELDDGGTECSPWTGDGPEDCPLGEAHFPGTPGCALLGAPCPADGWPAGLPAASRVLYVRQGASGGDGTRGSPFAAINQALAEASSGDAIAVARGTYDEAVDIGAGIALYGACPTETILTNSRRANGTVILVTGRGAEIHDISIRDAPVAGIFVDTDTSALIEGVEIASVEDTGVVILQSDATLSRVSIRDVARRTSDGAFGVGVTIESGATASISELSALRCHLVGVTNSGGRASVSDSVIRDVLPDPATGVSGYSFWTLNGAETSFTRIASIGQGGGAIITAASTAVVEDAWIDGTNGSFGVGVASLNRAEVTVSR
ncbi:MAG: right-handed parallel beta-helix repeat-containing protein, partial [Deltaproteobacteria bacterium]|nr:right-handed parallel beta-helix repeat-containing protein [Deltaproteobacteria bacterium]